jgi:hypothetical protein
MAIELFSRRKLLPIVKMLSLKMSGKLVIFVHGYVEKLIGAAGGGTPCLPAFVGGGVRQAYGTRRKYLRQNKFALPWAQPNCQSFQGHTVFFIIYYCWLPGWWHYR